MKSRMTLSMALALGGTIAFSAMAAPGQSSKPELSELNHQTLQAMAEASTWGHPDLHGQFSGMQAYAHGHYEKALKQFKYGARYADKLSQLSIGLLYLNGEGVDKNPATAWAWLSIAAERGFPNFVATRDRVWKTLDASQRQQARKTRGQLAQTYADKVAKPRMAKALKYWRSQMTGSRTGFDTGVKHVTLDPTACSHKGLISAPIAGCSGDLYAKWRWDPKQYFAVKDSRWESTVTVGDLEKSDTPKGGK